MVSQHGRVRVAFTLEQCWHDVPGGTAVAALGMARALSTQADVELVGVAARHRRPPPAPFQPPIPVRALPLPRRGAVRGVAPARLASGRAGHRTGRRGARHHHHRAAPPARAAGRDRSRPRVPPRARARSPATACGPSGPAWSASPRSADVVLCSSQATLDDCERAGLLAERLRLVPLGLDPVVPPSPGRDRGGAGSPRHRPALPAVRRHARAPQEPAPSGRGLRLARLRPRAGRGGPGRMGCGGSSRRQRRAGAPAGLRGRGHEGRALRRCRRRVLPEPAGRVRAAGARGDGARHAGRDAARTRRPPRWAATPSCSSTRSIRRTSPAGIRRGARTPIGAGGGRPGRAPPASPGGPPRRPLSRPTAKP